MPTERSESLNIYYESHGSGRPVVLVAAWPLNGDAWEKQIRALIAAGYRVIQYDRRGFGRSDRPAFGYDIATLAADLQTLIETLDLRDAVLIGHSMGGAEVARYFGACGSSRVRKAIFVATVNPYLLKAADNPDGLDAGIFFEGLRAALISDPLATVAGALAGFYNATTLPAKGVSQEKLTADFIIASQASAIATHDCVSVWGTDLRADHEAIRILRVEEARQRNCRTSPLTDPTVQISRSGFFKTDSPSWWSRHA